MSPAASRPSGHVPDPGVTRHDGSPVDPQDWFFFPPPEAIKPLRSAQSSLRKDMPAPKPSRRTTLGVVVALLGAGAGWLITVLGDVHSDFWFWFWIIPPTGLGFLVGAAAPPSIFEVCTYVGKNGAALMRTDGLVTDPPEEQVLLYDQADEAFLDVYPKRIGRYNRMLYSMDWYQNGVKVFSLEGEYNRKARHVAGSADGLDFAEAVERAWSEDKLGPLMLALEQGQPARFRTSSLEMELARDVLRLGWRDGDVRWKTGEVASVQSVDVRVGGFVFPRIEIRPVKPAEKGCCPHPVEVQDGALRIPYDVVPNARLFILAARRVLGV
jgi:hypothetical protein